MTDPPSIAFTEADSIVYVVRVADDNALGPSNDSGFVIAVFTRGLPWHSLRSLSQPYEYKDVRNIVKARSCALGSPVVFHRQPLVNSAPFHRESVQSLEPREAVTPSPELPLVSDGGAPDGREQRPNSMSATYNPSLRSESTVLTGTSNTLFRDIRAASPLPLKSTKSPTTGVPGITQQISVDGLEGERRASSISARLFNYFRRSHTASLGSSRTTSDAPPPYHP
ncbi:hypothetical protein CVT24_011227 [Panaeolus cyanescens]|uniref:Uncharacterized protein n=1 Tax=Panaeolus cyanescens TaxID=181874 RepID=A0A409YGE8_9AGAR|nr:hypothetical protein CVT24_011227 [Panaeolus cyanescens]